MLPPDMEIEQDGSVVTCRIHSSELSHIELSELVEECMQKMRFDNARNFVLDLSEVDFMSSSCIGVLVAFLQEMEAVRGRIALANCRDNVQFLFKVTRLDSVFQVYDDVPDAVASF